METVFNESGPRTSLALPPRTLLHDNYEIGRVLGKGGFGITYAALDQSLKVPVAIKEFLPAQVAGRGTDRSTVEPHSGGEDNVFQHGLDAFLSEAQTLAQFNHPNIVSVKAFFRANGTGYLVMPFYEGQTLDAFLDAHQGPMPHDEALKMVTPILNGLAAVHASGVLHRDIKPQNVYLTDTGGTVLLDFGAARIAFGEESQSLSAVLTPGYAPFEQYSRRGHQGPWTDVYATAAMLYRMVTGTKPPEATDRIAGEPLPPPHLSNPALAPAFSAALTTALSVQPKDRPQTIDDFRLSLSGDSTVVVPPTPDLAETQLVEDGATIVAEPPTFRGRTQPVAPPPTPTSGTVLILEAPSTVRYKLDGGGVQTLNAGGTREVAVEPGSHQIAMAFGRVKHTTRLTVQQGERRTVTLAPPSTGSKPQRLVGDRPRKSNALWWALGGAAVLLVLLTVVGVAVGLEEANNPPEVPPRTTTTDRRGLTGFDDDLGDLPPGGGDELDQAIQAEEQRIRAAERASGGVVPTSGIGAIRFSGIGEPVAVQGVLGQGDGVLPEGEFADLYMFQVTQANYLFAELTSSDFDAYLVLMAPNGEILLEVDDLDESDRDAYLDAPLPFPGIYRLFVTSAFGGETGRYDLVVTPDFIP